MNFHVHFQSSSIASLSSTYWICSPVGIQSRVFYVAKKVLEKITTMNVLSRENLSFFSGVSTELEYSRKRDRFSLH